MARHPKRLLKKRALTVVLSVPWVCTQTSGGLPASRSAGAFQRTLTPRDPGEGPASYRVMYSDDVRSGMLLPLDPFISAIFAHWCIALPSIELLWARTPPLKRQRGVRPQRQLLKF